MEFFISNDIDKVREFITPALQVNKTFSRLLETQKIFACIDNSSRDEFRSLCNVEPSKNCGFYTCKFHSICKNKFNDFLREKKLERIING